MAEQGLDVELTGYARATSIRAMLSGDADIIEIDSGSALLAYNSGAPLEFVSMPIPGALDVVSPISVGKIDRRRVGKKWATSGTRQPGPGVRRGAPRGHKIGFDTVTFVPVGSPLTAREALLAGRVDITTMTIATSPEVLAAVAKGTITRSARSQGDPGLHQRVRRVDT